MNTTVRFLVSAAALAASVLGAGSVSAQVRYSYASGGAEVVDSKTGLTWRRCPEGMVWSGGSCTGRASTYTHEAALLRARDQAGTVQWRLPNRKELASIVDRSASSSGIDLGVFPSPPSYVWSSSPSVGDAGYAWGVHFLDVVSYNRGNALSVWLVRDSQ